MAEQIEHSLGVNLPKGATSAHFMSSYSETEGMQWI